jgi:hypothetical protein
MTHLGTCTHGLPEPAPSPVTRHPSSVWSRGARADFPTARPPTRIAPR